MKLSIWQQFSSNHSNTFTVVGEFPTKTEALSAANKLRQLLEAIYLQGIGYSDTAAVQAELDAGREFGFDWTEHLDWVHTDSVEQITSLTYMLR